MLGIVIENLINPQVILFLLLGTLVGAFIGALPGLSATMGVALLIPMTYWLEPEAGLAMLIAIYCSAIFAGGVPAILVNTPGTPASMTTAFDGYAMTQKGQGKLALGINAIYSALGGIISTFFLLILAKPIASFALSFGPPEYFALAIFGLVMMISVSGQSVVKGLMIGFIGLFISTIGLDSITGNPRFTFEVVDLLEGISFIPIMIGLFGIGEVLYQITSSKEIKTKTKKAVGRLIPNKSERKKMRKPFWFSSLTSVFIGAIPGAGGDIASIVNWEQTKKFSKNKHEYGNGSLEGLSASATSNNGVIGGAFTTMLTLGIPGDSVTAILIGALMVYGMQPGPEFFATSPEFGYTIIGLLFLANFFLLALGLIGANLFSKVLLIKQEIVWVSVVIFCIIGSYALNNSLLDVWIMLVSGVLGYVLKKLEFPFGPLILALILGPILEDNLRRSFSLNTDGALAYYTSRPIFMILIIISFLSLFLPLIKRYWKLYKKNN